MALFDCPAGRPNLIRFAPQRRSGRSRGAFAFTLIELLVVIAIIAILAGLLMPVLSRARFNAKNTACKSNLRPVGLGLLLYTETHEEYPPITAGTNAWQRLIDIPCPRTEDWKQDWISFVFICPLGKGFLRAGKGGR